MKLILEYLQSGECFIYKDGSVILGCYVLKEINIDKVELVNIVIVVKINKVTVLVKIIITFV